MFTRRRQKFIDFEVQSSLVRRLMLHWCIFLFANLTAVAFWVLLSNIPLGDQAPTSQESSLAKLSQALFPMVLISVALIPAFIWDSIKLSNRFVGPVARVRKALSMVLNGETPPAIAFRTGDFWQSLAMEMNSVLELQRNVKDAENESVTA